MENYQFRVVIKDIIKEFRYQYLTVNSLHKIIEKLKNISFQEIEKYRSHIVLIEGTINNYGNDDKMLTYIQRTNIIELLERCLLLNPKCSQHENNFIASPFEGSNIQNESNNIKSIVEFESLEENLYYETPKIEKFELDDIIVEVVFGLLSNLSRKVMVSTLTVYVLDYFESSDRIIESHVDKYQHITSEIRKCLETHGWKCKTIESAGGFQSEPSQKSLLIDLEKIINRYF